MDQIHRLIDSLPPAFWIVPALLVLAAIAKVAIELRRSVAAFPYRPVGVLLSPAERSFLGVLDQAVSDDCRIFAKVRLADLIEVEAGVPAKVRRNAFNRISQKHIDFCVCRRSDLAVLYLVELDDSSHKRKSRASRDRFVDQALQVAGVPILRFQARRTYLAGEIAERIEGLFEEPGRLEEPSS